MGSRNSEFKHYAAALWRWLWLIVLITALGGTSAYLVGQRVSPTYEASTSLVIQQSANGSAEGNTQPVVAEKLVAQPVLAAVIEDLSLDTDPKSLARRVRVTTESNTPIIVVTAQDPHPQGAANIANGVAKAFVDLNRQQQLASYTAAEQSLQQDLAKAQEDVVSAQVDVNAAATPTAREQMVEQVRLRVLLDQYQNTYQSLLKALNEVQQAKAQVADLVTVIQPAELPGGPIGASLPLYTLLGAAIGCLLSAGSISAFSFFDDSLRTAEEAERAAGAPVLSEVSGRSLAQQIHGLKATDGANSQLQEHGWMLAAAVEFSDAGTGRKTIVVTSANPHEGRSTIATSLAIAMAQIDKRVILVDSDLRHPCLHEFFRVSNARGFTTALLLDGKGRIADCLVPTSIDNLSLMPSGPQQAGPARLLGSSRMARLIDRLKEKADVVIFDSPPLLIAADAAFLAHVCGATLLVARAGVTSGAALSKARERLSQSGTNLMGVVLSHSSIPKPSRTTSSYRLQPAGAPDSEPHAYLRPPVLQTTAEGNEGPGTVPGTSGWKG